MVIKRRSGHAVKLHESPFGIRPKGFDAVDVSSAVGKLVLSVVNTIMLLVAQINQAAVAAPGVGMDQAVRIDSAPNDGQQGLSGTIRHDLRIDRASSLEDSKDRGFAIGTPASFAFDAPGAKVGFIDLDLSLERRGLLTELGDPLPDQLLYSG
jgi:hypothetical protein